MCHVKKFCYCCDLKTGAIIVNVFTVLSIVLYTVLTIISFTDEKKILDIYGEPLPHSTIPEDSTDQIWILRSAWIVTAIFGCIVSVCLCFAISQHRANWVIPWLVWDMLGTISLIISAVIAYNHKEWIDVGFAVGQFPINIYIWICMYSYYLLLKGTLVIDNL